MFRLARYQQIDSLEDALQADWRFVTTAEGSSVRLLLSSGKTKGFVGRGMRRGAGGPVLWGRH